ncbi:uncharacterized protein [Littorina saxatilis]|uniref:uncharacterized protein n=1 Tax=Littorina saxatilis TaxID=31220 RepID=UPI0038B4EBC0
MPGDKKYGPSKPKKRKFCGNKHTKKQTNQNSESIASSDETDKQSNVNKTVVMLMLNHLVKKTRVRSHRYKQRKDASYRPDTENSDADSVSTVYSILPLVQPLPTKGKVSSSNEAGGKGATST